ncbi:hypothetical protein TBK1r_63970 [Stieleria magnilauensis]|uniref:Uncharacterized protein n=1 Tax=Stieleria magnilauensis TaxID=2527963 RepID=A0ABX5XZA3_9BACT|nr:hypothetical protein TBK1r_63970 [Planctomycetes bacterium TBK1r]
MTDDALVRPSGLTAVPESRTRREIVCNRRERCRPTHPANTTLALSVPFKPGMVNVPVTLQTPTYLPGCDDVANAGAREDKRSTVWRPGWESRGRKRGGLHGIRIQSEGARSVWVGRRNRKPGRQNLICRPVGTHDKLGILQASHTAQSRPRTSVFLEVQNKWHHLFKALLDTEVGARD